MEKSRDEILRHVDWNTIAFGSGCMSCTEADEIIEEILTVLISRNLTIEVAQRLLKETSAVINKEFILGKR